MNIWIIVAAMGLVIVWVIATSNRIKTLSVKVDEAGSGIDVALTKRYDTLTKMMDTVKAHRRHERDTIVEIVNLRTGMSTAEKIEANQCMDEIMKQINVAVEAYPELRSAESYVRFKIAIADVEAHLQAARRLYNANVSAFNRAIVVFPASVVARACGHGPKEFFEAEISKRGDVKIAL